LIQIVVFRILDKYALNDRSIRGAVYLPCPQNDFARLAAVQIVCEKCGLKKQGAATK
jgi:hypothetical protein